MLPERYILYRPRTLNLHQRVALLTEQDVRGGFLELNPNDTTDPEARTRIVLFERPDGSRFVGVSMLTRKQDCHQLLIFLEYRNGQWADITYSVIDRLSEASLKELYELKGHKRAGLLQQLSPIYVLPRQGKSIQVYVCDGAGNPVVAQFKFENGVFRFYGS